MISTSQTSDFRKCDFIASGMTVQNRLEYSLCDTGKDQISIQRLLILCSASCETEIIFAVVDISFDKNDIGMSRGRKNV